MKHIDVNKLKAEIDKRWKELADKNVKVGGGKYDIEISTYLSIKNLITSLQQDQPEPSNNLVDVDAVREGFIAEVYRVLDADPTNDRANAIIDAFDSLPTISREQSKVDLVAELKHHLDTTPKEQLEKEWKELEPWCNIGPTVQEFLYGKQPEVDLEKELEQWRHEHFRGVRDGHYSGEYLERKSQLDIARHFYQFGLNARKKE